MGAHSRRLLPVLLLGMGVSAAASPLGFLQTDQSILEAHQQLIAAGWQPAATQTPSERERQWAAVTLSSLSSCSGSGAGFCWFDYQRQEQRLSVVTVPSKPGKASIGRVNRWW